NPTKEKQEINLQEKNKKVEMTFFEMPLVSNNSFIKLYDALVPLSQNKITIEAGKTYYIFFKLIAKSEGSIDSYIDIDNGKVTRKIPLTVQVLPVSIKQNTLNVNVWSYL